MAKDTPAFRKRQQIANTNKTMLIWVAAASALVAVAMVVSYFLLKQLTFNEKVLAEKSATIGTLRNNTEVAPKLQDNIRVLGTNSALESVKSDPEDSALQAVLDALPADANSLAFGASLQRLLIGEVEGATIESASVDPVVGIESSSEEQAATEDASVGDGASEYKINFSFTIVGNDASLREVLQRLERSIRPVVVTSLTTESATNELKLTVSGHTYYEPARTVELKDKTVTP